MKIQKALIIVLGIAIAYTTAAQDTVRMTDSCYHFNRRGRTTNPWTIGASLQNNLWETLGHLPFAEFSRMVRYDGDTISPFYGIAITYTADSLLKKIPLNWAVREDISNNILREGGQLIWNDPTSLWQGGGWYFLADSNRGLATDRVFPVEHSHCRKDRIFEYLYDDGTKRYVYTTELYFATPKTIDSNYFIGLMNSAGYNAYVKSINMFWERAYDSTVQQPWYFWEVETTGENSSIRIYPELADYNNPVLYSGKNTWGFLFPVIGLRCGVPQHPKVSVEDGEIMLTWKDDFLDTATWQISIGTDAEVPENNTIASVAYQHPFYIHGAAPAEGEVWYARLRRACRYKTSGYDTVVWSEWSKATVIGAAGIVGAEQGAKFEVNPNPTEGKVTLRMEKSLVEVARMTVMDLTGREVLTTMVPAGAERYTLDMGSLPKGAYLLRLTSEQGMATRKVVKL